MYGTKISAAQLSSMLSNIMGRTVVDKTGLNETFNVHIEWKSDESTGGLEALTGPVVREPGAPAPDSSGASIFTVLQEQLGLKLESQKGPVVMLVIDHAEKASEN